MILYPALIHSHALCLRPGSLEGELEGKILYKWPIEGGLLEPCKDGVGDKLPWSSGESSRVCSPWSMTLWGGSVFLYPELSVAYSPSLISASR